VIDGEWRPPAALLTEIEAAVWARDGKQKGHDIRFLCPAHDDHNASADWSPSKSAWCCRVCGAKGGAVDLAKRLGIELPARRDGPRPAPAKVVYVYCAEDGGALYEIRRGPDKKFLAYLPGASKAGIGDARRVLYRLPELLAADADASVFVCEGEKDVDNVSALGLTATTNPFGAGKWAAAYGEALRGRKVIILPDNDAPGRRHAEEIGASLCGLALEVRVLALPGLGEREDVSDWLDNGGTAEALRALAATAPLWEPRPIPNAAALLDGIAAFVRRYVVLTPDQAAATALWVLHTHAIDAADATGYLHITSPEKRSGKTRKLEVLDLIVARPWLTGRCTAAVLQRRLERDHPTLLLDETDAAFKKESEYSEALRAILNAGHRRGVKAWLCVKKGGEIELVGLDVFGPKALAGIGKLPDTVADRAIRIVLRRRAPSEPVARFYRREAASEAEPLRAGAEAWAAANVETLRSARPDLPTYLDDRALDGWEPLFAIADLAGKGWSQRARMVALGLSNVDAREDESAGVRLLADIRVIFNEHGVDRLPSSTLLTALNALDESPWGDWYGKPLTARGLARLLKPFMIKPRQTRFGVETLKGYETDSFADAWERYLPIPVESETSETGETKTAVESEAEPESVSPVSDSPGSRETDAEGCCPACRSTEAWYRPDGSGPVCSRCHPNPLGPAEPVSFPDPPDADAYVDPGVDPDVDGDDLPWRDIDSMDAEVDALVDETEV
jgi:hypothetical protein